MSGQPGPPGRRRRGWWLVLLVVVVLAAAGTAFALTRGGGDGSGPGGGGDLAVRTPTLSCDEIGRLDLSGGDHPATITASSRGSAVTGDYEVCDVHGTIAPSIDFQIQLPTTTYRQRYLQIGCGGLCGTVQLLPQQTYGCAPLGNGTFVTATNDFGHDGSDGTFGADPQLRADFAYRADHELAAVAKNLIAKVYGDQPRYSYFDGCSQGGHEALAEVQRYLQDFDGVIAGAPALLLTELNSFYQPWLATVHRTPSGASVLTGDAVALVHDHVMQQCDGLDGLEDGQIEDPRSCGFDLTALQCPAGQNGTGCLSAEQVAVFHQLYWGPTDSSGQLLYPGGQAPGSELAWPGWFVQGEDRSAAASIGQPWLAHLAFAAPLPDSFTVGQASLDQRTFDEVQQLAALYDARDPDLSAFRDAGGKLIMYHGWADEAISPYGTVAYYGAVADTMGGYSAVQDFARLYMVPGMFHCGEGRAPNTFDTLTPMLAWVEQGKAPAGIVARDPDTGRTRPVFPYPQVARYDGSGSTDDAANFAAADPGRAPVDVPWLGSFPTGGQLWYSDGKLTEQRPDD